MAYFSAMRSLLSQQCNVVATCTAFALRHTHASQLIAAGVDVATVSKRLGHATPAITLSVYTHMFKQNGKAPAAINAMKW